MRQLLLERFCSEVDDLSVDVLAEMAILACGRDHRL